MNNLWNTLHAEVIKIKYASVWWVTFIAFALAPLMGAVFMVILSNPEATERAGALSAKARLMNFSADWNSYLSILTQAIGVGGILVFGFVASWVFGREYSDGTAKDLLSLPTSRVTILNAKFIVYAGWCVVLVVSNLALGLVLGLTLDLPLTDSQALTKQLQDYAFTTILTIPLGCVIAFFAIWGKGYLAPLGFVAITLVVAQVIAATGFGTYFPWSVPGLYSTPGQPFKDDMNWLSYTLLILVSGGGYGATVLYWQIVDQSA